MDKKFSKMNMRLMLMLVGVIPVLCTSIILTVITNIRNSNSMKEMTYEKLALLNEEINSDGEYYLTEEFDYSYIDNYLEDDIVVTIFEGDTRKFSSVRDASGNRAEGTQAGPAVIEEVLKKGNPYTANNVDIAGSKYYVSYLPIKSENSGEIIGMTFCGEPQKDVEKEINSGSVISVVIALVCIAVFVVIIVYVSIIVANPLKAAVAELELMANNDFTSDTKIDSKLAETQKIVYSLETFKQNLKAALTEVQATADSLNSSVDVVADNSANSADGAGQVAQATDELSKAVEALSIDVQAVATDIGEMAASITEIVGSIDLIAQNSDTIRSLDEKSSTSMHDVEHESEENAHHIDQIYEQAISTKESVSNIDQIVSVLLGIAGQTRLLALNASIEAARAGEAGRGFAVVAENISQLADESTTNANSIVDIVKDIVAKSNKNVELASEIRESILEEEKMVLDTENDFHQLDSSLQELASEIVEIRERTEVLNQAKDDILEKISNLSAISEESAASTEEITASVENVSQNISEVSNESKDIAQLSHNLQQIVSRFRL